MAVQFPRTTYARLFEYVCPKIPGLSFTLGSNALGIPVGEDRLYVGGTIEHPALPNGTTITSMTGAGSTKIASVVTAAANLFFRPGVVGTGYQPTLLEQFTGTGYAPGVSGALQADQSLTVNTLLGSTKLASAPATAAFTAFPNNSYVTGLAGVPADSRSTGMSPRTAIASVNSRTAAGNLTTFFPGNDTYSSLGITTPALETQYLIRRQFTHSGFTGTGTITGITASEESNVGGVGAWNWITGAGNGWFAPWDLSAPDTAKLIVNRGTSGGSITDANSTPIATINPATAILGAYDTGSNAFNWQVGQPLVGTVVGRQVGNALGDFAVPTRVTAHSIASLTTTSTLTGNPGLFWATGAAAAGTVGQYFQTAANGILQNRITALRAEFTSAGGRVSTAGGQTLSVFANPGILDADLRVGQFITITGGGAANRITALGSDFSIPLATSRTAANPTNIYLPVGFYTPNLAQFSANRKLASAGSPAIQYITASTAENTTTTGTTDVGGTSLFFSSGSTLTALHNGAYVISNAGGAGESLALADNNRITALPSGATPLTLANLYSFAGVNKVFRTTGSFAPPANGVVGQHFTLGTAFINDRVATVPVASFTSANSSTVLTSNQLYVQPGLTAASLSIGQFVSGANIPANTTLAALGADVNIPLARTTTATSPPKSAGGLQPGSTDS